MVEYRHHANYYETDQMGIIHHSNYIRWMEEARVYLMDQMGFGYRRMEDMGIVSPVLSVQCEYKNMVRFDDTVIIRVFFKHYNGIKLTVGYEMVNESTGQICTVAESSHCFLDANGKLISLKKACPEAHAVFCRYKEQQDD